MDTIKNIAKKIISRPVIVTFAILFQLLWLFVILYYLSTYSQVIELLLTGLSLVVVAWIINRNDNPNIKLAWIIPILLFPWVGGILFLMTGGKLPTKKTQAKMMSIVRANYKYMPDSTCNLQEITQQDTYVESQLNYLARMHYPIYKNTQAKYFSFGEEMLPDLLEDLRHATKFIFIEFFIIHEGTMWDEIHEILKERADHGVDVRIIYDDIGSIGSLPDDFAKKRIHEGIRCYAFNRFIPIYSVVMNNRDHRKFVIVDGNIGYTGGVNIGDEYVNRIERFGVWKDTAVRLSGEAVWNMTIMYLNMWDYCNKQKTIEMEKYKPSIKDYTNNGEDTSCQYVVPYGHSPYDQNFVAKNVYLNLINHARYSIFIFSPYLGIDDQMQGALINAAKRGVDIKLITPGIPDKKIVYQLTKSEYGVLIKGGIHIYQYTPGFDHAKCFLCDDEIGIVGTINLDYRSLYHHFEDGVLFYKGDMLKDIRTDFEITLKQCEEIKRGIKTKNIIEDLYYAFLRLMSPLL